MSESEKLHKTDLSLAKDTKTDSDSLPYHESAKVNGNGICLHGR